MARRAEVDMAATAAAIALARRRRGRRLGEDEEWKFFYDEIFNAEAQSTQSRLGGGSALRTGFRMIHVQVFIAGG